MKDEIALCEKFCFPLARSEMERKWWKCIILLLLFARRIDARQFENDAETSPTATNRQNFDTIDFANQQNAANDNLYMPGGQTIRIETSGELDDAFWLKHLGEDYKYAIQLQLGDKPNNDIYTMAKDTGNHYRVEVIPVNGYRNKRKTNSKIPYIAYDNNLATAPSYYAQPEPVTAPTVKTRTTLDNFHKNHVNKISKTKKTKNNSIKKHLQKQRKHEITKTHNQNRKNEKQTVIHQQNNSTQNVEQYENNITFVDSSLTPQTTPSMVQLSSNDTNNDHLLVDEEPPVIYHQNYTYSENTPTLSPTTNSTGSSIQYQQSIQEPQLPDWQRLHEIQYSTKSENTSENTTTNSAKHGIETHDNQQSLHTQQHTIDTTPNSLHPQISLLSSQNFQNQENLNETSPSATEASSTSTPSLKATSNSLQNTKNEPSESAEVIHFTIRSSTVSPSGEVTDDEKVHM